MSDLKEPFAEQVLSGQRRGPGAVSLRAVLACIEPCYAAAMSARNRLYDLGILPSHRLAVPVISVGNITTGGTGKTPIVRWLAGHLQAAGKHPAILMRGYKSQGTAPGDEQALLQEMLSCPGDPAIPVHAQAHRAAGGRVLLREHPQVDVLLLDDGFQHRRLHRDFDLVLIDATSPFGYGHVLPRGLLREPLRGLARADAFILTRADQVSPERCKDLTDQLRGHNHRAPVYRARHAHLGLHSAASAPTSAPDVPLDALNQRPFFVFAGIGRPASLHQQLLAFGHACRGQRWFDDHHSYRESDLRSLRQEAAAAGAEVLVTTEKDWVKLRNLPGALDGPRPIWRLDLAMALESRAEEGLLSVILARIEKD